MAPLVSVVVPTRNRAGLLRHAVATVIGQSAGDLEVVVSDNHSSDGTAALLADLGDPRLRVVRPPEALPVCDHWDWAVAHARGEWVMVLGDDDGLVPRFVERVAPLLDDGHRALAWRKAWYFHPDADPPWPDPSAINHLVVEPYGGSVDVVAAREELARSFARQEREPRPAMNGLFRRDLLDEVRRRAGRVHGIPDPAYTLSIAVLAIEPAYVAVDLPLVTMGISGASISAGLQHRLARRHAVVDEYERDDLIVEAPLQARTSANLWAESLLRMRRALPDELTEFEPDAVRYLVEARIELDRFGAGPRREWARHLRTRPLDERLGVRWGLARRRAAAALRAAGRRVPAMQHLRRRAGTTSLRVVDGRASGFSDLPSAAAWLDANLLPTVGVEAAA